MADTYTVMGVTYDTETGAAIKNVEKASKSEAIKQTLHYYKLPSANENSHAPPCTLKS